jgi:hypothetical protein
MRDFFGSIFVVGAALVLGLGAAPAARAQTTSDVVLYVGGALIGPNNNVQANVYAAHGTLRVHEGTEATGAFIGKNVRIGDHVRLTLASAFQ